MIEDQKTGFLCEPGDIREFEKRILELAGDKALRDRMKSAARQLTVSKCGADRMLESYERVFQSAGRSGRRDEQ
jgi:glycosyltransferase involved in cell wall biosynthesis